MTDATHNERSTPTELERDVMEAWPGCEYERGLAGREYVRVAIVEFELHAPTSNFATSQPGAA